MNFVPGCGSAWLERRLREAEVASSNPATPIVKSLIFKDFLCCISCCNLTLFFVSYMFPFNASLSLHMHIETFRLEVIRTYFRISEDYALLSERRRGLT